MSDDRAAWAVCADMRRRVETDRMPIAIARWLVRSELEAILSREGSDVARDLERAIQMLIDDAVARDRFARDGQP